MGVRLDLHQMWEEARPPNSKELDAPPEDGEPLELDLDSQPVELLWVLLLHLASRDQAWCIRYDLSRSLRLSLVTCRTEYELIPPPDELAGELGASLERLTRPPGLFAGVADHLQRWLSGRANRTFTVFWKGQEYAWVASWPKDMRLGAIVLYRTDAAGVRSDGPPLSEDPSRSNALS
jgi:hypothetical protein